ncbi:MAG: c-type cytochrome domain-containing protein [Planctomycetota bacterium]
MLRRFCFAIALAAHAVGAFAVDKVTYETHVKPILREHCFACHNQDDATADLALDNFDAVLAGGAGGEVLVAGDPEGSRLWKLVTHQEAPKMPPGDKLPQAELDILRKWIAGGLLNDANSKPLKSNKPAIAKIDSSKLGKPVGDPAMPEQLYHEPVLWATNPGPVEVLATSPWAPLVAVGWQRQISFYHTETHELLGIVPYIEGATKVVRFSRDGSLLLVAGGRHAVAGSASLFDVKTGARLATFGDELDIVLAADISPDLSLVAIGGPKKKVRVYRVADGVLAYEISKHTEWVNSVGFSPDGKFLATADRNGGALIWQAAAGHERADLRGHTGAITSLDWRADSAMLATASEDGTVRLWNPKGNQIKSVKAHKSGVQSVRFAQNGNWVTAGRDRHVRTWKPEGTAIADLGKLPEMTLAAAFTHDGNRVVASDYSGEVRILDSQSKKLVARLQANPAHLAARIAKADDATERSKRRIRKSKKLANAALADLQQGKGAHETHQAKLARAESSLQEKRKLYAEAATLLEQHKQQLEITRAAVETTSAALKEAHSRLEQALATEDDAENGSAVSEQADSQEMQSLNQQVALAQQQFQSAEQQYETAQRAVDASSTEQSAAQKSIEVAEDLVAQVGNETAGLPDLQQLDEAYSQAAADLAIREQERQHAERASAKLRSQQQRFTAATKRFAQDLATYRTQQTQLATQSGRLEAEHQQAAMQLATHIAQLNAVAQQLETIQAKIAKLKKAESDLKASEADLGQQLREIRTEHEHSLSKIDLVEQQQRDFEASQQLRKKYSSKE